MSTSPDTPKSGIRTTLEATGIPAPWFRRPKLPSRNTSIFLTLTTSIAALYIYDRQQCKKIRSEYVHRVQEFARAPLHSLDMPRKVTVYGAKWPGDDDHERCLRHFRKYVKPILVAAAVDYELISGKRHGDIAERVANDIIKHRRVSLGLERPMQSFMPAPVQFSAEELRRRELDGGVVIVGRHTLKEFMAGLKHGWSSPPEIPDKEDDLARILEPDGHFDELEGTDTYSVSMLEGEPIPTRTRLAPSRPLPPFSPLQVSHPSTPERALAASSPNDPPLSIIPRLPPLLLVSYRAHFGFAQIPLMVRDFFTERYRVRAGAEEGYRVVKAFHRPLEPPHINTESVSSVAGIHGHSLHPQGGDLNFAVDDEQYYPKWARSIPEDIERARKEYYTVLPKKLETARELARRVREPTKEEQNHPPPTEVELRAERLTKELRWRSDLAGWDIVKRESPVTWDERFRESLDVFVNPPENSEDSDAKELDL